MGSFADALAQTQQFVMNRELQDSQQQQADLAQPVQTAGPYQQSGLMSMLPQLAQLAQQGGGGGGAGGGTGPLNLETIHGVEGNARAMGMLQRVAQQYPGLWSNVVSDYRTRQQQAQLYQQYLNGNGNLAAPPGHSMHEKGLAFDISSAWLQAHPGAEQMLQRLGGFPVQGEPWHWQPQFTI